MLSRYHATLVLFSNRLRNLMTKARGLLLVRCSVSGRGWVISGGTGGERGGGGGGR